MRLLLIPPALSCQPGDLNPARPRLEPTTTTQGIAAGQQVLLAGLVANRVSAARFTR
jgi:hypothetical protein